MRAWRTILWVAASVLLAALVVLGAFWFWSKSDTSLATVLQAVNRLLPAGTSLEARGAKGSLRSGGQIASLRWQQDGLTVQVDAVTIGWTLTPLLAGELRLTALSAQALRIDDRRAVSPRTAPADWVLPLRIDAPFSVAALDGLGTPALQAQDVAGHYVFDGKNHTLQVRSIQLASGHYKLSARVQAIAPLAVVAQLQGTVQTQVPSVASVITAQLKADLQGSLAGADAALDVQVDLNQQPAAVSGIGAGATAALPQATLQARLHPWQSQPITQAQARWKALDLAALWPQAPQTQLSGEASVQPDGSTWKAHARMHNSQAGTWDRQRLPLEQLDAELRYDTDQWTVTSLRALGAGARIAAQGGLHNGVWQVKAVVDGINPAGLDSRLAPATLSGTLSAEQTAAGVAFATALQAGESKVGAIAQKANALERLQRTLQMKALKVQGVWLAPVVRLDTLVLDMAEEQLRGTLTADIRSQALSGNLALSLPGAHATLAGAMASTDGHGEWGLTVTHGALASRWLDRLPGRSGTTTRTTLADLTTLTGRWQGGWQHKAKDLHIDASLRIPQLDWSDSASQTDPAWHLRAVEAELSGTLPALELTLNGRGEHGTGEVALQSLLTAGLRDDGVWQGQLRKLQLTAEDRAKPGAWALQLGAPLELTWTHNAQARLLAVASGTATLTSPSADRATMEWQAGEWSQKPSPAVQGSGALPWKTQWNSRGRLQNIPLAWVDLLGSAQMSKLGLRGDVLLGGEWDAQSGERLSLHASLTRSSGDLQLQPADSDTGSIRAGLREARVAIDGTNERLTAHLQWDSERAGQVQADFKTQLQSQDGVWTWSPTAALEGNLQAKLPAVGGWSVLMPPGWRLRGSLDARAVLSGTRAIPQWSASLEAQDLAVRSEVDGINFSQGTLRATLKDKRLDIVELTLHGADSGFGKDAKDGGSLALTGVVWLPEMRKATAQSPTARMEFKATAKAFNLTSRADQRLVLSGDLTARLNDSRLTVNGALKADQALFVLPENDAPALGDDVVVRATGSQAQAGAPAPSPAGGAPSNLVAEVAVTLDLGSQFQVQGYGLRTRLAGSVDLRSSGERGRIPYLAGELHTVSGTYKAYGQYLNIEEGILRFSGRYDNPALNILAIRPNLQQRVGVQILGTAQSPAVRLYAEPDLPEAEKMAWLVLGRSAANGGAEAAVLQQAALALLGRRGRGMQDSLAGTIGLDEISVRGTQSAGEGSATGATLTLGKRFSSNLYVAYERSLAGTLGAFYIFYELSRRLTLRAQTGEQSAVDLIYTLRYD